jgi:hypothetical protein
MNRPAKNGAQFVPLKISNRMCEDLITINSKHAIYENTILFNARNDLELKISLII